MLRAAASLFFYARFFSRFSAVGLRRRSALWQPFTADLRGQTWVVTGASGGIGQAIALGANARGAQVIAVARDVQKLAAVQLAAAHPERLACWPVDLSLVAATRKLAAALAARQGGVSVLVNNVGVLLNDYSRTAEGLETSFATNLLNHFVLTEALHAKGALQPAGVVINMSSGGMYGAALDLATIARNAATEHDGMAAYAQHKRAQVELTRWWNQQWQGRPTAHVMHPGWVDTDGVRSSLPAFRAALQRQLRNPEDGADTALWLGATRPAAAADGGIWLDRVLDPEHEFGFTRKTKTSVDALVAFLRETAARIA